MNHPFIILIGAVLSIGISWNTLIVGPQKFFGQLPDDEAVTSVLNGQQKQGRHVYASAGCVKCHTQQVRFYEQDAQYAPRFTTANDFVGHDKPVLGQVRFGPDLSNVGNKDLYAGSEGALNLYSVLFHAKTSKPLEGSKLASLMPRYTYLFDSVALADLDPASPMAQLAEDLGKRAGAGEGIGYLPNYQGEALVKYLQSLKQDQSLFVSPIAVVEDAEESSDDSEKSNNM